MTLSTSLPLPRRMWWPWDQPADRVGFYRTFTVREPAPGVLYVSASGPYTAWLDGASYPAPEGWLPSWRSMHAIPLQLALGEHCLSFEAFPGDHGQPFILACLDWEEAGGPTRLATDAGWRMQADPPSGWASRPPDGEWRPAWAFDGIWAEPWGMPCNAPSDLCRLSTGWQQAACRRLEQVVAISQGLPAARSAARLLPGGALELHPATPHASRPPPIPNTRPRLEWYRTREAHSLVNNTWLDLFEPRAPHAVFDAGGEVFARLRLALRRGGPAILAVTTGESLNEVQRYARRVTDLIELRDGESFTTAPTGFRYVKVMALSCDPGAGAAELEPVELQEIFYPVARQGQFSCSDALLNQIWALSERTVHRCMQTEVWDGIKRDQLPWMGDLYTEALAIYHLFGDARLVRRTLAALAEIGPGSPRPLEQQLYPGLAAIWKSPGGSHPGAGSGDINGIPTYTHWWVLGLRDYTLYTGDATLVQTVAPELEAVLDHIAAWTGPDGLWRFQGGWDFIDWAPLPRNERETFAHLLAGQALEAGLELLALAGRPDPGLRQVVERMKAAARATWFADGITNFSSSHHANAMAIRSGVLSPTEARQLFAETLAADPPLSMTYWHRYLDLEAAALVGEIRWGLDYIRKHWGPALQLGLTTLWEAFDPAWIGPDPHAASVVGAEHARYGGYETSLCHGWSAGPAIWLHRAVLGIRPAAPGFRAVEFCPDLGDLEWARGQIPTPFGPVSVSLRRSGDGKPTAEIAVPPGIELRIPPGIRQGWAITL